MAKHRSLALLFLYSDVATLYVYRNRSCDDPVTHIFQEKNLNLITTHLNPIILVVKPLNSLSVIMSHLNPLPVIMRHLLLVKMRYRSPNHINWRLLENMSTLNR